ncbi:MAG: penicillin acylase family protein [Rhodospirillaceae bacterium]|nr:penicillin acylase family protein [Rhodospirillaceae bacterium]
MIRKTLKWAFRGLITLAFMLVISGVVMFFWFRTSLPHLDGKVAVTGIEQAVTIVRDQRGIPHIYAKSQQDAFFALGYVHAQDRLFQMEMQRRIGQGRVAEILGSPGLQFDRLFRSLGLYRRAQDSVKHLKEDERKALRSYAAGVNQWLETRKGSLPPEFNLIGMDFEPWKPADTLVWGKLMAIRLSTNWQDELLRAQIIRKLGKNAIPVLYPSYPGDGPTTIEHYQEGMLDGLNFRKLFAALPGQLISKGASNAWAIRANRTTTSSAILASDPHLGMDAPVLWYLVSVNAPDINLSGASVPGAPALIMGHNGHIAWGLTTTYIDTDDIILEAIDPSDPTRYLADSKSIALKIRTEVIKVRFGKDLIITILESRNGPAVDFRPELKRFEKENRRLAVLRAPWLSRADTSAGSLLALNKAKNWDDFNNALRRFVGPVQNFLYADKQGNIGHFVPGLIPVRKNAESGYLPQDGSDSQSVKIGYIPFEKLPRSFNPPDGILVTANNRIVGENYPYFLSKSWGDHYRARRIEELLKAKEKFSPEDIARIQADHVSLAVRATLPLMLRFEPQTDLQKRITDMLKSWDGSMSMTRPEPLIYTAWLRELNIRLYADELGDLAKFYSSYRPDVVINILSNHRDWCNDVMTDKIEDCAIILRESLEASLVFLSGKFGDDPILWRWGSLHYMEMKHSLFGMIPLLNDLTTIRIPANGSPRTVNKAAMNFREKNPFAARQGPGFRGVYDLSDLSKSVYTISTGQSGNPYSFFYDNLVKDWRDVRHWRLAPNEATARENAVGVLVLQPSG